MKAAPTGAIAARAIRRPADAARPAPTALRAATIGIGEHRHPGRRHVDVHDPHRLALLVVGRRCDEREDQPGREEQRRSAAALHGVAAAAKRAKRAGLANRCMACVRRKIWPGTPRKSKAPGRPTAAAPGRSAGFRPGATPQAKGHARAVLPPVSSRNPPRRTRFFFFPQSEHPWNSPHSTGRARAAPPQPLALAYRGSGRSGARPPLAQACAVRRAPTPAARALHRDRRSAPALCRARRGRAVRGAAAWQRFHGARTFWPAAWSIGLPHGIG